MVIAALLAAGYEIYDLALRLLELRICCSDWGSLHWLQHALIGIPRRLDLARGVLHGRFCGLARDDCVDWLYRNLFEFEATFKLAG